MIEERYLNATKAKHLRDDPHELGQIDLIKASGMSARNMAAHYLRLITKPTRDDLARVYAALLNVVNERKLIGGEESVTLAIDWLVQQSCSPCGGSGSVVRKGVAHNCKSCGGEGKRREPSDKDAQILIDYVMTCKSAHVGRMFRVLR